MFWYTFGKEQAIYVAHEEILEWKGGFYMSNNDVFTKCPSYETEHFILRKMEPGDSKDLFLCYSNKEAARYFNGDSCNDDFYYTDYDAFLQCVEYWNSRYEVKDFVRLTIIDKDRKKPVGTVEICPSKKYSVDDKWMGILRIDILPEYETEHDFEELMREILLHVYTDYQVDSILMKAQDYAVFRRAVLQKLFFVPAKEECNISYQDYFICYG